LGCGLALLISCLLSIRQAFRRNLTSWPNQSLHFAAVGISYPSACGPIHLTVNLALPDVGEQDSQAFIAMEFLDGQTLKPRSRTVLSK
jgi:hypothetical protein